MGGSHQGGVFGPRGMRLPAWLDHSGQGPSRTMSQDAKFFQRGKIQVRVLPMRVFFSLALHILTNERSGVPPGTPGCRDERQEVHEAKDRVEEDCREHYYGE